MVKFRTSEEEFEKQYAQAVKRGAEVRKTEPQARSVSYERATDRLIIELKNGATFAVPCQLLPELRGANPDDIAEVKLRPRGAGLHWRKLDQDFTLAGLLISVLGDTVWLSEIGRKGGRVSSDSKVVAARANGLKGGRPAKARLVLQREPVEALLIEPPNAILGGMTHGILSSPPHLAFDEMNKAYGEHTDAWLMALRKVGGRVTTVGALVNHPSNVMPAGAALFGQSDKYTLTPNGPTDVQEAANSAELALAA